MDQQMISAAFKWRILAIGGGSGTGKTKVAQGLYYMTEVKS